MKTRAKEYKNSYKTTITKKNVKKMLKKLTMLETSVQLLESRMFLNSINEYANNCEIFTTNFQETSPFKTGFTDKPLDNLFSFEKLEPLNLNIENNNSFNEELEEYKKLFLDQEEYSIFSF